MKDYYRILDLSPDATQQQIKDRYRQLVRIFHPDRYPKPEDKIYAEQKLQEINKAYEAIQGGNERGLRLSTDTRPPRPVVYPAHIDLGSVVHGERAHALLQIDNLGGLAQSLSFHIQEGVEWFAVTKGERMDPNKPLPMLLHIEARTESLNVGQTVENWLDIDVHGVRARATLRMDVVERLPTSYRPSWIISMIAATAVLLTLVYVVWNLLGPASAGSIAVSPTPLGLDVTSSPGEGQPVAVSPAVAIAAAATIEESATETETALEDVRHAENRETNGGILRPASHAGSADSEPAGTKSADSVGGARAGPPPIVTIVAAEPTTANLRGVEDDPASTIDDIDGETSLPAEKVATVAVIEEASATPTSSATIAPSATPSPRPTRTSTPTPSLTPSPTPSPTPTVAPTATVTVAATVAATPTSGSTPRPAPPLAGSVTITVPSTYQINARADTTVDSLSLGLLDKGATFPAIARTIDNAWTQIVLEDGRVAWVFTASMEADLTSIATLPVSLELLDINPSATAQSVNAPSGGPAQAGPPDAEPSDTSSDADVESEEDAAEPVPPTHLVQSGDFLKQIAARYYGDEDQWRLIYEANVELIGPDPNLLPAGVKLTIPAQ